MFGGVELEVEGAEVEGAEVEGVDANSQKCSPETGAFIYALCGGTDEEVELFDALGCDSVEGDRVLIGSVSTLSS